MHTNADVPDTATEGPRPTALWHDMLKALHEWASEAEYRDWVVTHAMFPDLPSPEVDGLHEEVRHPLASAPFMRVLDEKLQISAVVYAGKVAAFRNQRVGSVVERARKTAGRLRPRHRQWIRQDGKLVRRVPSTV